MKHSSTPRILAVFLAVVVLLGAVPGVVAAQETRTGGTVIIEEGETVDGLTAAAGNVVVRGTVDGDLTAFAGNVDVEGEVTGDVDAFAGNVRVHGDVGGDVNAATGNLVVGPDATIAGSLAAGAGTAVVDGTVRGNVELGAGSITLGPTASVGGDFEYDAESFDRSPDAQIGGTVTRTDDLGGVGPVTGFETPMGLGVAYGLLVNFVLGAVLLLVFPAFSASLAARVAEDPVRTGGVGLLVFVGVPVLLVLIAFTIIGIPLSLVGGLLFALLVWVGYVYGAFGVGTWLLSLGDYVNRWGALAAGLIALAILDFVPILGGIVQFVVVLLGMGALARGLRDRYRGRRAPEVAAGPSGPSEPRPRTDESA